MPQRVSQERAVLTDRHLLAPRHRLPGYSHSRRVRSDRESGGDSVACELWCANRGVIRHVLAVQTVPPTRTPCEKGDASHTSIVFNRDNNRASIGCGQVSNRYVTLLAPLPTTQATRLQSLESLYVGYQFRHRNSKRCPHQAKRERGRSAH